MDHTITEVCPFTGLPAKNQYVHHIPGRTYSISISSQDDTFICLPPEFDSFIKSPYYNQNKHLIIGALLNGLLPVNPNLGFISIPNIQLPDIISKLIYPSTPQEKLDNFLNTLVNLQNFDGEMIEFMDYSVDPNFYYKLFFKSQDEMNFYLNTLFEMGFIKFPDGGPFITEEGSFVSFFLSFKCLQYYLQLKSAGIQSNKCFIAMSFNASLQPIREAIKSALVETGFKPILIDEVHYGSDQTINDAIISHLRESRFCIADFTEQRNGVYFESGFALGQNKQVIYTCHKEFFEQSHFDTNHFPHIIYETPDSLKDQLINKIKAWIV
jgi:hypothetical protein